MMSTPARTEYGRALFLILDRRWRLGRVNDFFFLKLAVGTPYHYLPVDGEHVVTVQPLVVLRHILGHVALLHFFLVIRLTDLLLLLVLKGPWDKGLESRVWISL